MKRIICLALTVVMVFTASTFVTFASKGKGEPAGKGKPSSSVVTPAQTQLTPAPTQAVKSVEDLRKQWSENIKNNEMRKAIIKQIVELKKKNKDKSTPVIVNGVDIQMDVPPVIKSGRTLIPVAAITKAIGATVKWDPATQTVTISKVVDGKTVIIVMELTKGTVTVDGKAIVLEVNPQVISNRTMVPISFIAITLKKNVSWDKDTGAVIVDDDDVVTTSPTPTALVTSSPSPMPSLTPTAAGTETPAVTPSTSPVETPIVTPTPTPIATPTVAPATT